MAGFLYYIPGHQGPLKLADLRRAGLGYAFESERFSVGECMPGTGPDGTAGAVVSAGDVPTIGIDLPNQTWQKIPGSECWAGMAKNDPPGPQDCERKKMLPGEFVECGDEQNWVAPVAVAMSEPEEAGSLPSWHSPLPRVFGVNDDGGWTEGDIVARYRPLWDAAMQCMGALGKGADEVEEDQDEMAFDLTNQLDAALLSLSTNYRIGLVEANMLGLFSTQTMKDVLLALVDWDKYMAWVKKNPDAITVPGSNTSDGEQV